MHGHSSRDDPSAKVKAVLGPTNTGKTHLAIERLCAHSSGAIGFPLRLLAREVYDRVRAIKGDASVALITGEERIEPRGARWMLCTAEAMPVVRDKFAFVALDEAQLGADRERGHVFTDRLLHARGREETMILGSSTVEPLVRALIPRAEIVTRPRFSTLTHTAPRKLSRIPPRSAIVAFSAEQVYTIAEMLRRFRGGAAVVMGALSPETRNRQVALYQSGEVDYIVATDAIGMGLNLDIDHVAFAGLGKFDGQRQRRLTTAEMAQIAGRAGRHQRDGSFGTLAGIGAGAGGHGSREAIEFTDEEIYAIEEHRFAPLTRLFWRDAEPRFDSLATLIGDLEAPPDRTELAAAPEAIDLSVLKRLADEAEIADTLRSPGTLRRFWEVCRLPDFRQQGGEFHARFVARLWQDLRHGELGADYMAQAIAQLDHTSGDIDTLQGRIAAIRSWAYIAQRPDWVLARDEMAARARAVEARLSDALHARLTERFVNRRTAVLMKKLGPDAALLPVRVENEDVFVEDAHIGRLSGFCFEVDPLARAGDRKLLLAAAERHLPGLLADRAEALAAAIAAASSFPTGGGEPPRSGGGRGALGTASQEGAQTAPSVSLRLPLLPQGEDGAVVKLRAGTISWNGQPLASLKPGRSMLTPGLVRDPVLDAVPANARATLLAALDGWLARKLETIIPLAKLEAASRSTEAGPDLRALLIRLVEAGGVLSRADAGLDRLDPAQRTALARLGVTVGALDVFVAAMLRPAPRAMLRDLGGSDAEGTERMPPVLASPHRAAPYGYRRLGKQIVRVDIAEKLLREAHDARGGRRGRAIVLDPARAVSMGLATASYARLLHLGGFRPLMPRALPEGAHGPIKPLTWRWQPERRKPAPSPREAPVPRDGAFAALATMFA